eukprot:GHUV01039488.1.p1 GENE.GHUV01039488.1~~GHUV01039488.1.p1  ORF type:complete len:147 (-),score=25.68 GHUV01039488.1:144-584(-)
MCHVLCCLAGLELVLNTRVASVRPGYVKVVHKEAGEEEEIPFGACVWATGIAMNPLVKQLQQLFPKEQKHFRWACSCSISSRFTLGACSSICISYGWRLLACCRSTKLSLALSPAVAGCKEWQGACESSRLCCVVCGHSQQRQFKP